LENPTALTAAVVITGETLAEYVRCCLGGAFYLVGDRLIDGDTKVFKNYENETPFLFVSKTCRVFQIRGKSPKAQCCPLDCALSEGPEFFKGKIFGGACRSTWRLFR
jgi:hypothetical protein